MPSIPAPCISLNRAQQWAWITHMIHRHLNHENYTLAAIDSVIGHGKGRDWLELRRAARTDRSIMEGVLRIAIAHAEDPYDAERYLLWKQFADRHLNRAASEAP